jgi:hypothetical protein
LPAALRGCAQKKRSAKSSVKKLQVGIYQRDVGFGRKLGLLRFLKKNANADASVCGTLI